MFPSIRQEKKIFDWYSSLTTKRNNAFMRNKKKGGNIFYE